jgi:hypothetical protein
MNDNQLIDQIDPALAVGMALNAAERTAFGQFCLVGKFDGATSAEWLHYADEHDAYEGHIDPWWEKNAADCIAYLRDLYPLPERILARLLRHALYATFGISSATLQGDRWSEPGRRTHVEIASGASLWVLGYAEAAGWTL